MPPVSYLVDGTCWRTFCASPTSFRLLHLALTFAGLLALLFLAARRFGLASALVVGVLTALSPRLIETGVEIRAYPLFFAITCAQLVVFFAQYDRERCDAASLGPFLLLSILATYVHFYGLVSSMALLFGLLLTCAKDGRQAVTIMAAAAILGLTAVGLLPFISGAVAASGGQLPPLSARISNALLFPFRVLGHPAHAIRPAIASLYFGSLVILLIVAAGRYGQKAVREFPSRRFNPVLGMLVALVAGLAATALAALFFHGFDALKPSYSIWMLPVVALAAGAAVATPIEMTNLRILTLATVCCLTVAASMSLYVFLRQATWFVHGPASVVSEAIQTDGLNSAVVYRGSWGYSYYPTYYRYGDAVSQWWIDQQGSLHRITRGGAIEPAGGNLSGYEKIILVDIRTESYAAGLCRSFLIKSNVMRQLLVAHVPVADRACPCRLETNPQSRPARPILGDGHRV